jgi:hypothetical protein
MVSMLNLMGSPSSTPKFMYFIKLQENAKYEHTFYISLWQNHTIRVAVLILHVLQSLCCDFPDSWVSIDSFQLPVANDFNTISGTWRSSGFSDSRKTGIYWNVGIWFYYLIQCCKYKMYMYRCTNTGCSTPGQGPKREIYTSFLLNCQKPMPWTLLPESLWGAFNNCTIVLIISIFRSRYSYIFSYIL